MDKQIDIDSINMKQIKNAQQMVGARFPELVERYLSDASKYINGITDGLAVNDWELVQKNAHAIKSSSASLGVTGANEVAKQLEYLAKSAEAPDQTRMKNLASLLNKALQIASPKLNSLVNNAV